MEIPRVQVVEMSLHLSVEPGCAGNVAVGKIIKLSCAEIQAMKSDMRKREILNKRR